MLRFDTKDNVAIHFDEENSELEKITSLEFNTIKTSNLSVKEVI